MAKLALNHTMMSNCLLDPEFYKYCPYFQSIQARAQKEYDIRKAAIIKPPGEKGCSSCKKRKRQRARDALKRKHGALFVQFMANTTLDMADFASFKQYIRDNYAAITGYTDEPAFETIVLFVPRTDLKTGLLTAVKMEI